MTSRPARALFLIGVLLLCTAHVGSPDVWFEGEAGPYHVIVYVRVPTVVPGIAEVNVRTVSDTAASVTAMVTLADATAGLPPPDVARPTGDDGWYSARLWIMAPGSNIVTVRVTGARGAGTVTVPVTAVANLRLPLGRPLGLTLAGLGIFLFVGVISIVGAAVREGVLPPGEQPTPARRSSARRVMLGCALGFGLLGLGGKRWWDAEDAAFQRELYRPFTVMASVGGSGAARVLHFDITDSAWTMRGDSAWVDSHETGTWSPLMPDHGKLMHLFLVRDPDLGAFAHLHPATADSVHFTSPLPSLPAGRYRVYGDVVHESGFAKTLVATVELPDGSGPAPAGDDATYVGGAAVELDSLSDGSMVHWRRSPAPLVAGRPASLSFDVSGPRGVGIRLEPYLGMLAHAVVVRDDGAVFVHLHPMGTVSGASIAMTGMRAMGSGSDFAGDIPNGHVTFPYAFPSAGRYRIWVQVKRDGRVETAAFAATVAADSDQTATARSPVAPLPSPGPARHGRSGRGEAA